MGERHKMKKINIQTKKQNYSQKYTEADFSRSGRARVATQFQMLGQCYYLAKNYEIHLGINHNLHSSYEVCKITFESQPEVARARRCFDNAGSLSYMTSQNNQLQNSRLK
jgi:hypothetical protein